MAVQTDKLKRMFDSDSKLMLDTLRQLVSELSSGDADADKVDRAFRAAHSIKSEAGFLELSAVADAAHTLEESLAVMRSGDMTAGSIGSNHDVPSAGDARRGATTRTDDGRQLPRLRYRARSLHRHLPGLSLGSDPLDPHRR